MNLKTLRRGLGFSAPADDRVGRLRKVLDRANVCYRNTSPEAALLRLPVVDRPPHMPRQNLQKLKFPLAMPARVALFEEGFLGDGAIRRFAAGEAAKLRDYVPEALVLSLQLALTLADQKQRRLLDLPALKTAVILLIPVDDAPPAEHHRTLLWRTFGVPLFEQLRGWTAP